MKHTKVEIDINADVGEGMGNDALIMPYISSCNIACGGHAGNRETIEKVVELAVQNNVAIGAHPSYPDKENFGRVSLSISAGTGCGVWDSGLGIRGLGCRGLFDGAGVVTS